MSDTIVPRKRCSKCGEEKPASPEYFYRSERGKYGLQSWCKDCIRLRDLEGRRKEQHTLAQQRLEIKQEQTARGVQMCTKCGLEYPATVEFFNQRTPPRIGFSTWCRKCFQQYRREVSYPKQGHKAHEPIVIDGMRRCAGCKKWKPLNSEHFTRNARDKYGFSNYCRPCKIARGTQYNRKIGRKPQRVLVKDGLRMCKICERWLPNTLEFFNANPSGTGGTDYRCRKCTNARRRELDRLNPGRKSNHDKKYRAKYPDKVKASRHQRLARELSLPEEYEAGDWQRALDYFGGCCAVCGRPPGLWHTLAADHWIPITAIDCPGTVPENIIPLCHGVGGCNNSKSNRPPVDWLIWKFGKRKANKIRKRIEAYFEWLDK